MSADDKKPSRFERQLAIMGLGEDLPAQELVGERQAMDAASPRPLVFPKSDAHDAGRPRAGAGKDAAAPRRARFRPVALPMIGILAAASMALIIARRTQVADPPAFQVMGAGDVQVFSEVHGEAHALAPDADLPAGARVKAAVLAPVPSTAFWGVISKDGKMLSDPAWIAGNRLALPAGERRFFGGSLALDGASEGEILAVVTCPASRGEVAAAAARAMTAAELPAELAGCHVFRVRLRR